MGICIGKFWNSDIEINQNEEKPSQKNPGTKGQSTETLCKMAAMKAYLTVSKWIAWLLGIYGFIRLILNVTYLVYAYSSYGMVEVTMINITELMEIIDWTPEILENTAQVWTSSTATFVALVFCGVNGILLGKALKKDQPRTLLRIWQGISVILTIVAWGLAIWDWQLFNSPWIPVGEAFLFTLFSIGSIPFATRYLALVESN